ncbi:MAG: hypothetical protein ABI315_13600 [Bacteroidia bacterium]
MSLAIQQKLRDELNNTGAISYKEVCEILEAFQISSGQGFAIGKTKAVLEYLKKERSLIIENFDKSGNSKTIHSIAELAKMYREIDPLIDLSMDKEFKDYF